MQDQPTRDRIKREAMRLFVAHGIDAVSMRDIADAVGLKAPSLYAHFKTIADDVDIPIFVYNVPARTVTNMTVETLARIEAGQENCLIAHQPGRAIDGSRIAAASLEIGLGASDKETAGIA